MIQVTEHTKAVAMTATSGVSFLTAHWFITADHLIHLGASGVSIVTGIGASVFYIKNLVEWVHKRFGKK